MSGSVIDAPEEDAAGGGEVRPFSDVWAEIQAKARELQETGEPLLTLDRGVSNVIVEVSSGSIARRSEEPRGGAGVSRVGRHEMKTLWDQIIDHGEGGPGSGVT